MSFISQDEALRRLRSPSNLANSLNVQRPNIEVVTPPSRKNTPPLKEEVRTLAAVLTKIDGPDEAAKQLGITKAQVRAAERTKNPEVRERISKTKERIIDLALTRVMESLGLLDIDTIRQERPRDISAIAMNMSKIAYNLSPRDIGEEKRTLVIYAPHQRETSDFSVIDI